MVTNIPRILSAVNLFINVILIPYCRPKISENCNIFEEFIDYLYFMIFSF
jgi:hypothetical protein